MCATDSALADQADEYEARFADLEAQVQSQLNIINTDEGVADVYAENKKLGAQLEAVKLLPRYYNTTQGEIILAADLDKALETGQ
jgi:uncharacterized coiled-coil protein SlyX